MLFSDSSDLAWGGVCADVETGGPLAGEECEWHIKVKELMAGFSHYKLSVGLQEISILD